RAATRSTTTAPPTVQSKCGQTAPQPLAVPAAASKTAKTAPSCAFGVRASRVSRPGPVVVGRVSFISIIGSLLNGEDSTGRALGSPERAVGGRLEQLFAPIAPQDRPASTIASVTGFPLDRYTPHGYLDNPGHAWRVSRSGVLRSTEGIG